jgi:hypothetical protein
MFLEIYCKSRVAVANIFYKNKFQPQKLASNPTKSLPISSRMITMHYKQISTVEMQVKVRNRVCFVATLMDVAFD